MRFLHSLILAAFVWSVLSIFVPSLAHAQAQVTYVRLAKGTPTAVFTSVDLTTTGTLTGATFNMSGYSGFYVNVANATDQFNNCTKNPWIVAQESTDGVTFTNEVALNTFLVITDQETLMSYFVATHTLYARLKFLTTTQGFTGNTAHCLVTVTVTGYTGTPPDYVSAGNTTVAASPYSLSACATLTYLSCAISGTTTTLQNVGTGVSYCGFDNAVSSSKYSVVLAADPGGPAGTGGSWTLHNFNGTVVCCGSNAKIALACY
jgi:hypothetical protein